MALQEALHELLEDGIPKTSSQLAIASRKAAEELLEWIALESNSACSETFTSSLIELIDKAFPGAPVQSGHMQASRERMWGMYYSIRTSQTFTFLWSTFLQQSNSQATSLFYQSVTDKLFEKRIEFHFPISSSSESVEVDMSTLTFEEENALRYAAGYVLRTVRKKISKSSSPQREELIESVDMLFRCDDEVEEQDASSSWMAIVDRGGLVHISNDLYRVFVAMELNIRGYLRIENASKMVSNMEGKIVSSLLANEDVLFYWCIVCCEIPEDIANVVLKYIAELWTTIRGFSFAKSFMELYKQKTKKPLQRSKALRKNLLSGNL